MGRRSVDDGGGKGLVPRLSVVSGTIAAFALLGLVCHLMVAALSRVLLDYHLPGTVETVSVVWMPVMAFFALASTELARDHPRVTLALTKVRANVRARLGIGTGAVSLGMVALMLYYSISAAEHSRSIREATGGATHVPIWPVRALVVVALLLYLLQVIANLVTEVRGARR